MFQTLESASEPPKADGCELPGSETEHELAESSKIQPAA